MEKKVQDKILKKLKEKKCYILKTKPGPGTPKGCPDIIFLLEGFWGAIEVKAHANSPYQTLQPETIAKFQDWSWCRVAHAENVDEVLAELDRIL